jgi:ribosomal protein S18 acetylase RimI-like enzyme
MSAEVIRLATPADRPAAYHVCLKTGDHGRDGEALYRDDPDALGRIYVGPYLTFEPELSFVLEDDAGVSGYVLAALDSHAFYARVEHEWRPRLCARFPEPTGDPSVWTPVEQVHYAYHHPDDFCPEPYDRHPSHLHIDLLERARGRGHGRRLIERVLQALQQRGSPGVHLGMSARNTPAYGFYQRLGFREVARKGNANDGVIYMATTLNTEAVGHRPMGAPDRPALRPERPGP